MCHGASGRVGVEPDLSGISEGGTGNININIYILVYFIPSPLGRWRCVCTALLGFSWDHPYGIQENEKRPGILPKPIPVEGMSKLESLKGLPQENSFLVY